MNIVHARFSSTISWCNAKKYKGEVRTEDPFIPYPLHGNSYSYSPQYFLEILNKVNCGACRTEISKKYNEELGAIRKICKELRS